jgi:hypothetical protein
MLEWTTTMIGQLLKIPLVPRFYSNHLEPSLQATLSRLADLDLQFDCLARIGVPCEVLERRPKPEAPVAADGPVNALPVPY